MEADLSQLLLEIVNSASLFVRECCAVECWYKDVPSIFLSVIRAIRLEVIASRMEPIAVRLEAIALRLETAFGPKTWLFVCIMPGQTFVLTNFQDWVQELKGHLVLPITFVCLCESRSKGRNIMEAV